MAQDRIYCSVNDFPEEQDKTKLDKYIQFASKTIERFAGQVFTEPEGVPVDIEHACKLLVNAMLEHNGKFDNGMVSETVDRFSYTKDTKPTGSNAVYTGIKEVDSILDHYARKNRKFHSALI